MTGYRVTVVDTEACPTAVARADPAGGAAGSQWRPLLDAVWSFLRARPELWSGGHNVMLYASRPSGGAVLVEAGVQVTGSFAPGGNVEPSALPATTTATTMGPLSDIGAVHDAVRTWCTRNERPVTGVFWEVYGDPDPSTGLVDVTVHWELGARDPD